MHRFFCIVNFSLCQARDSVLWKTFLPFSDKIKSLVHLPSVITDKDWNNLLNNLNLITKKSLMFWCFILSTQPHTAQWYIHFIWTVNTFTQHASANVHVKGYLCIFKQQAELHLVTPFYHCYYFHLKEQLAFTMLEEAWLNSVKMCPRQPHKWKHPFSLPHLCLPCRAAAWLWATQVKKHSQ